MKKVTAIICSVIMSCAMFVSCGDESSSSKAEETSSAVTSEVSADDTSDSKAAETNSDATYAAAYTEKLKDGNFSIEMTTESDYTGAFTIKMESSGENFHMYMDLGEYGATDTYYLDGKMYTLEEATKTYMVFDMSDEEVGGEDAVSTGFGLEDDYDFVSSEETDDGLICETYSFVDEMLAADSETEVDPSTVKYYFDKSSGDLKKIEVSQMGITQTGIIQTVTVNSFVVGDVEITLPDLTDWTETDVSSLYDDEDFDFSDSEIEFSEEEPMETDEAE